MKYILVLLTLYICGCEGAYKKEKGVLYEGQNVAMPEFYRKITGYDSIQLVFGGRGKYNEEKKDFDVTWDSMFVHFCYPNQWEFEKFKILNDSNTKMGD